MLTFITILGILAIVYWVVAFITNKVQEEKVLPNHLSILVTGIITLVVLSFVAVIPAQECGVVVTPGGVKHESYKTGWHMIMPWYNVVKMDKTVQVYTCANLGSRNDASADDTRMTDTKKNSVQGTTIWAPTVDGIKMGFAISASWKIDEEYAWWIYDNVSELDDSSNGRFLWLEESSSSDTLS